MGSDPAVCPSCAESVPHARLSCPSCGSLLASVAAPLRSIAPPPEREDARASAPPPIGAYVPPAPAPSIAVAQGPLATAPDAAAVPPPASLDTEMPAAAGLVVDTGRLDEAARWFVGVGGALAAIGFVLPWSEVVIGSAGLGGYLDRWGLAGPGHALVFLVALIVVGLAAVPGVAAPWLRSGVLGIGLGGLLLGLSWPYLVGPLGAGPGVTVAAVATVLLMVGGVAVAWSRRHAGGGSAV